MKKVKYNPFTNGTQFMAWMNNNCDNCQKYENESTERSKARCKYAFDIEATQGVDFIPLETLQFFGFKKMYTLGDCPELHLQRVHSYSDLLAARKKAEKEKKTEIPFNF